MKNWLTWIAIGYLLAMPAQAVFASETAMLNQIRVPKPRSEHDVSQQYYVELLHKALQKAAAGRPLPHIMPVAEMEQGRAVRELQKGQLIDLF